MATLWRTAAALRPARAAAAAARGAAAGARTRSSMAEAAAAVVEERAAPRHLTKISDYSAAEVSALLAKATEMKRRPELGHNNDLQRKTLLMLFEKPSLRTRVSFETGMTQLGGHAIYYNVQDSPLGEKETVADTARVLSRYVDAIMVRVKARRTVAEMCAHSAIPVINALDDFAHPCQMLADLLTITECVGGLNGVQMAYLGDTRNNVTYDLMRSAALMGFHLRVAGPPGPEYQVEPEVLAEVAALSAVSGAKVTVGHDAAAAVRDADVVYTDSWMSYGIPSAAKALRESQLRPYQVTVELMKLARPKAIFMNCLPAMRGMEQEAAVIDGPQSVVFQQAENRLHAQKALLHMLLAPQ